MLKGLCRAGVEGMTDMSGSSTGRRELYKDIVSQLLSFDKISEYKYFWRGYV